MPAAAQKKQASDKSAAEWLPITSLKPWKDNPRNNLTSVEPIANAIIKLGWGRPIVARKANGEIIAGHTALLAAFELVGRWQVLPEKDRKRWHADAVRVATQKEIPVRMVDVNERTAHTMALADNRLSELSRWSQDLVDILPEFSDSEIEIMGWQNEDDVVELYGLEPAELEPEESAEPEPPQVQRGTQQPAEALAKTDPAPSIPHSQKRVVEALEGEDDIPEPPKAAVTKPGTVWTLGRHILVCGKSGSAQVAAHIPKGTISLITDPPYCSGGFQEGNKASGSVGRASEHKKVANDRLSTRGYMALMRSVLEQFGPLDVHAFTDWKMWSALFDVAESSGQTVRSMIVWAKPSPGLGVGWRAQHELILYSHSATPKFERTHGNFLDSSHLPQDAGFSQVEELIARIEELKTLKDGAELRAQLQSVQTKQALSVIQHARQRNELHTTQKPVAIMEQLVAMADGDWIGEPFAGSGTTLIAAEKLAKPCFAVELDPVYCDVIVERWQHLTGQKAKRRAA